MKLIVPGLVALLFSMVSIAQTDSFRDKKLLKLKVVKDITFKAGQGNYFFKSSENTSCNISAYHVDYYNHRVITKGTLIESTRFSQHADGSRYEAAILTGEVSPKGHKKRLHILCDHDSKFTTSELAKVMSEYFEVSFEEYPTIDFYSQE